jgi:hypothetical protein
MAKYKNLGGNSGVSSYEIGTDSIKVTFNDGSVYLYNNAVTGKQNIDRMKSLAETGSGLNSFIMTHVRKLYASKLR